MHRGASPFLHLFVKPISHKNRDGTVLNPRYEASRSTLVTTNLAFKDWPSIFPNATSLVTLIDRLTHHADVTLITGQSYRVRESEQEAAARQNPRPPKTP